MIFDFDFDLRSFRFEALIGIPTATDRCVAYRQALDLFGPPLNVKKKNQQNAFYWRRSKCKHFQKKKEPLIEENTRNFTKTFREKPRPYKTPSPLKKQKQKASSFQKQSSM